MKNRIAMACIMAILANAGIHADDWLSNIGFGVSSFPEDNGNVTDGFISYRFSPEWAASVRLLAKTDSSTQGIPAALKSLVLEKTTSTEIFAFPAEFSLAVAGNPLALSVGAYLSFQDKGEVGYFSLATLGMNSYDNSVSSFFIGPTVDGAFDVTLGFMDLSAKATLVPFFWYSSAQKIKIDPLVVKEGTNTSSGFGFPYLSCLIQPTLFGILAPDFGYEFQRFPFTSLDPSADRTGWDVTSGDYSVHAFSLRANLKIPLFDRGYAEIGYGRKFTLTVAEQSGTSLWENTGTLKLAFSLQK